MTFFGASKVQVRRNTVKRTRYRETREMRGGLEGEYSPQKCKISEDGDEGQRRQRHGGEEAILARDVGGRRRCDRIEKDTKDREGCSVV